MRHELVELRREQYVFRDSYQQTMLSAPPSIDVFTAPAQFDLEIEVLPLGVQYDNELSALVFRKWEDLIPANYSEESLEKISDLYWKK
jgi:hypothetical protein